jgi:hypothetical protein
MSHHEKWAVGRQIPINKQVVLRNGRGKKKQQTFSTSGLKVSPMALK